jgi:hypothetical protein
MKLVAMVANLALVCIWFFFLVTEGLHYPIRSSCWR